MKTTVDLKYVGYVTYYDGCNNSVLCFKFVKDYFKHAIPPPSLILVLSSEPDPECPVEIQLRINEEERWFEWYDGYELQGMYCEMDRLIRSLGCETEVYVGMKVAV